MMDSSVEGRDSPVLSKRWIIRLLLTWFMVSILVACNRTIDIDYEIPDQTCSDSRWGSVLFLYPHRVSREGTLFPDEPGIVFDRLSQFERFLYRYQADVVEQDVIYLRSSCTPLAVSYRGQSIETKGWKIYDIQVSQLYYYERGSGNWIVLRGTIPFPIHLLDAQHRSELQILSEEDNVRNASFDEIVAFARRIDKGDIDEEARTIAFSIGGGFQIVILDLGNGTVRFDKTEEPT